MINGFQLNTILSPCPNRVFFYPCSGWDLEPIQQFAPAVTTFWFVDTAYFDNGLSNKPMANLPKEEFSLIDCHCSLPDLPQSEWFDDKFYRGIPPYLWTERYIHKPSEKEITINFHRRRGPSALRKEIPHICVFYLRGTSSEGSSTEWLTPPWKWPKKRKALMEEVLERMDDGGLIVTDGSMCYDRGRYPYVGFLQAGRVQIDENSKDSGQDVKNLALPFIDHLGNRFQCVGYAGKRWERGSLLWRVHKAA